MLDFSTALLPCRSLLHSLPPRTAGRKLHQRRQKELHSPTPPLVCAGRKPGKLRALQSALTVLPRTGNSSENHRSNSLISVSSTNKHHQETEGGSLVLSSFIMTAVEEQQEDKRQRQKKNQKTTEVKSCENESFRKNQQRAPVIRTEGSGREWQEKKSPC